MEELFENKTKYSEKIYNIFIKDYTEENAFSEYMYMLFNIIFFGTCMIFAFIKKEIFLGIAIILGLLLYIFYKIIRPMIRDKKTRKGPKIKGTYVNTYRFYKNYFEVQNPDGKAQVFYMKIYKMVEKEDYYYIFLTREHAFILSKICFTKGTPLEFTNFMKKKIFSKYKNRIKTTNKKTP